MTEKRFEMGYDDGLLRFVKDNVTNTNLDIVDCWTVLNELNDKNEQLKNICKNLINEVNKRGITVTMTDNCKELLE